MDIKEGLVEIDPGDIDQLASSPVRFSSESSNHTRKQILQELPPPTMAMEIRSDETCDELNTRTMEEEGAEGVESGHLSGFLKPPSSTAETPIFPPQQPLVVLTEPRKGDVSFHELIKTLREPQLEILSFSFNEFEEDQENGNNSMWEACRNHRLQVLDVVSRCNSLKHLRVWSPLDGEEMDVLCKNLVSHPALEILNLEAGNDKGVEMLCCMLQNNHNIKELALDVEGDKGVEMLCQMLQNNHSIKTLTLNRWIDAIGVASLGLMLGVNSTLETLSLFGPGNGDTLKVLLQPLTCDDRNQLLNKSIKQLHLLHTRMGREGANVVAQMLLTNDSITHLTIFGDKSLEPLDVCTILKSLEKNETLHTLDVRMCEGVRGDDVLAKVMDLLRMNPWLKKIDLTGTPLVRDGHVAQVNAQLASNARDYMAVVKGLPRTKAKFARVFLCGDAYAGKTTLRRSMVRSLAKGLQAKVITPLVELIELNKPLGLCFNDPNEWAKRTRGIQIKVLLDHDDQKISIWDLAGQEEYHAFHDTMIPNLNIQGNVCLFLLVCNPFKKGSKEQKDLGKIKDELCYWLRFISSNTKRSSISPPQVMVVMTHRDKNFIHKSLMEDHLHNLKAKFAAFINLSSTCQWINAHSSREARDVTTKVTNTCGDILKKQVHVYEACMNVQHGLCEWNKHHPNQPIITKETFEKEIIDKKEPDLRQLVGQQEFEKPHIAVAMFLHDAGEMIYFKEEDFVVVNPSWFCNEVMGHLIKLQGHVEKFNLNATFEDGWGGIGEIEHLLNLSLKDIVHSRVGNRSNISKHLVHLMVKMDLAYEREPQATDHGQRDIFVPTTLEFDEDVAKGERRLEWKFKFPKDAEIIYIGRRLQCKDQDLTTLTPGFFPQVQ
ncbi:unnamed protein product, partial [Sphagnum compactum]